MKYLCWKCKQLAVWWYVPGTKDWYACDSCVPRGCSCNYDLNDVEDKDEQGRSFPCCEWDFKEEGYDNE
jgi:hypothetical protein